VELRKEIAERNQAVRTHQHLALVNDARENEDEDEATARRTIHRGHR
jgi:hypothetical protein